MVFTNLFSSILSPELQEKLFLLKIIFIFLSLFFVGVIVYVLIRSQYLKVTLTEDLIDFFTYQPFRISKFAEQWSKLTGRLERASQPEAKLIVIEADRMLDDILKKMGYGGEILGEKLKLLTPATLPNINQVIEAHKIRNNIVHDPDYRLGLEEAKRVLGIYEKALTDLQAL